MESLLFKGAVVFWWRHKAGKTPIAGSVPCWEMREKYVA